MPPTFQDLDEQKLIVMEEYEKGWAARAASDPEDEIIKSGVNPDNIRKWKVLQSLQAGRQVPDHSVGTGVLLVRIVPVSLIWIWIHTVPYLQSYIPIVI